VARLTGQRRTAGRKLGQHPRKSSSPARQLLPPEADQGVCSDFIRGPGRRRGRLEIDAGSVAIGRNSAVTPKVTGTTAARSWPDLLRGGAGPAGGLWRGRARSNGASDKDWGVTRPANRFGTPGDRGGDPSFLALRNRTQGDGRFGANQTGFRPVPPCGRVRNA